jgi:hypothetical protein
MMVIPIGGDNSMLSSHFFADEVDDKEPKCKAIVAINYDAKIGGIGMHMHFFHSMCICYASTHYCIHVDYIHILYEYIH